MPTSTYNLTNQVHSLSQMTNAAYGIESTQPGGLTSLQEYVTKLTTAVLTTDQGNSGGNYLGSTASNTAWSCVWGPVVYSNNPTAAKVVADNIMALYYNASENAYVLAIAGTNDISLYDWISEDLDANALVLWSSISAKTGSSTANISTGAAHAMNILLNDMTAVYGADTTAVSIITALQQAMTASPAANVYVTGHSLGGGITPLMALYLYENASGWLPGNLAVTINAMATAGPTFCDDNFSSYFSGLVGVTATNTTPALTYQNLCNSLDIVPMAMDASMMMNIPFVYDSQTATGKPVKLPDIVPDAVIGSLVTGAICMSYVSLSTGNFNNYTQIPGATSFAGTFQTGDFYDSSSNPLAKNSTLSELYLFFNYVVSSIFGNPPLDNSIISGIQPNTITLTNINYTDFIVDFGNYLLQIIYQHTISYYNDTATNTINVEDFITEFHEVQSQNPPPTASVIFTTVPEMMARKLMRRHLNIKNISRLPKATPKAEAAAMS